LRRFILALGLALCLAPPRIAEAARIEWKVLFNRGPLDIIGEPVVVGDNGPGDADAAVSNISFSSPGAIMSSDGNLGISFTLLGRRTPTQNYGRQLIVTEVQAFVITAYTPPINTPLPKIELLACYVFDDPGLPVGPPHIFSAAIDGFFDNLTGGNIHLAEVHHDYLDDSCITAINENTQFYYHTLETPPQVPFNSGLLSGPLLNSVTSRIGSYHRFTLGRNGDEVLMPNSSNAQSVAATSAKTPALSSTGAGILAVSVLILGTLMLFAMRRLTA
jgi:hypothetical protein